MGWESFLYHAGRGRAGMEQEKTMRGEDEDPILQPRPALPCPIAIPISS